MRICNKCGAANANTTKVCNECSATLDDGQMMDDRARRLREGQEAEKARGQGAPSRQTRVLLGQHRADIMFVLDCTGSMQGEINAIKEAITAFADTIKIDGVRARVGLIAFRDRLIGEEAQVLSFGGSPFTNDPDEFRQQVASLTAVGGGDEPESSLDALMLAIRQPFDPEASKVIVLVTDAPPHVPDKDTPSIEAVTQALHTTKFEQVYIVVRIQDPKSKVYFKLLGIGGMPFDLGQGEDFHERAEIFKVTLMTLGKTISRATRHATDFQML